MIVVFENKPYWRVIGSSSAPYLTSLARKGRTFANAHGVTHPSQPNYLALFSGSTQGVTDNSCPHHFAGRPNLARQLLDAGLSFGGFSEDLPSIGYTGCSINEYRRKHNPWVNFPTVPANVNRPFTAFPTDYNDLPTVSFVVPDLCHDMHDCSVSTGDRWAQRHLDPYVRWLAGHHSLLIVTFDEDDYTSGNRIPLVAVGPMVRAGISYRRVDHFSLLRLIEDLYGLPALGRAASAHRIDGVAAAR